MESSQTPPPGGGPATPPPAAGPPSPAGEPAGADGKAGAGLRIGAVVGALVLAIICAVAVAVMVDVNDTLLCEEVGSAQQRVGGYECYDFSSSVKPIVVGAGWIGAVLAGVAALLALAFTIRGRGGRILVLVTATAAAFLAISVLAAQI